MKHRISMVALLLFILIAAGVLAQGGTTYYIRSGSNVNARSCANTTCEVVTRFAPGTAITVLETVTGSAVSGSTNWYRVRYNNQDAYVHSSLVTNRAPAATTPRSSTSSNTGSQLVSTPAPSGGGCPNIRATCSQLTCAQAYACLAAGNRGLDRDRDGVPCESVCPGG